MLLAASVLLMLDAGTTPAGPGVSANGAPNARDLYMTDCAECHGSLGKGDGPRARDLKTEIHSFADCDWMSMRSDATLFLVIQQGSGAVGLPPEMPGFSSKLDDTRISDLIAYIRSTCQSGHE
jgi:mono/diheme cytochrome c family protein